MEPTKTIPSFNPFYIENVLIGIFFHDENFGRKDIPVDYTRPDGQHYSFIAGDYSLNRDDNSAEAFVVIGYYDNAGKRIEKTVRENDPEEMNALLSSIKDKDIKDELVQKLIVYESKREKYGTAKDNLRAVMRGIIGESSVTAKVTGGEEINVFAPDTSHYVVCGFRYDAEKKDYIISAYRGYPYEDDESVVREIAVKDMDIEDIESLLSSKVLEKAEKQTVTHKEAPATVFEEYKGYGYSARTYENARKADLTIAFAVNFTTAGEKCTARAAGDRHVPVDLNLPVDERRKEAVAMTILQKCSKLGIDSSHLHLNIAGNGICTLAKSSWNQERADEVVTDILTALQNHEGIHIDSIRSGGQTGVDEAGIKAGVALGLPTTVLAPKGWAFRIHTADYPNYKDIFSEVAFKARFSSTPKTRQTVSPTPEKNWTPMQNKNEHTQPGRISVVNVKDYNGPDGFEKASKNNVYIGRRPGGNILGNPFTHISDRKTMAQFVVGSRQESVDRYAEYFDKKYGTDPAFTKAIDDLYNRVKGGEDITLGCWCKPLACHGDIIKEKLEQRIRKEVNVQEKPQEEIPEKIDASPAPEKNWTPCRRNDGLMNYRDAAGHVLLKNWVDDALPFKDGKAECRIGKTGYIIDTKGIVIDRARWTAQSQSNTNGPKI